MFALATRLLRTAILAGVLSFLVPANAFAAAVDDVTIETGGGYARILFSFEAATNMDASVEDGVLVLRPGRKLAIPVESLVLTRYVTLGRVDADGAYRLALAQPVTVHVSRQALRTAIDLLPQGFAGTPPELAPPPGSEPERPPVDLDNLPSLRVRVGEHSNFSRLIFEWPSEVRYTLAPTAGRVIVRFDALARPDLSSLESRSPAWIRNPLWRIDGRTLVIELETDPGSTSNHFRSGNRIAVDVLAPRADDAIYRRVAQMPLAPEPEPAAAIATGLPQPVSLPEANADAASQAHQPAVAAAATDPARAELTRDGLLLRFPAARGKPIAVFARGPATWILLDDHAPLEPATLLAGVANLIARAEATHVDGAAVLRLVPNRQLIAGVSENERGVEITFSAAVAAQPAPISFVRQGSGGVSALSAQLPGAHHAISLVDPDARDRILVVPAHPGRAVLTARRFLELTALPTASGLAVLPRADDLAANVVNETAVMGRPAGLALSSASGAGPAREVRTLESPEGPAFMDFEGWKQIHSADVYTAVRSLRAAIADAPEVSANRIRLRLAQYMLAQNLAPEALGEVQLILQADPALAGNLQLTTMRGVAQYLMGRYGDARLTLAAAGLDRDPHAALWRGLVHARLNDWMGARQNFLLAHPVLRSYPEEWQAEAQLARAETALAMGDLSAASDALEEMPQVSGHDALEADYLAARVRGAQGQVNEAIAQLEELERSNYEPVAVRAIYARVQLQLAAKRVKTADAAETLERLRFRWRGDDLELNTLRLLGSIHFTDRRWREGFDSLKTAALNFPGSEIARSAQDDMRKAFVELFMNGAADALHPVQALSLFYDFIDLTPIGRDGDEMIRRLSDRLVAIDLLGPAEELLQHQVDERLEGVGRSFVAAKLAAIYLIDHKPREALNVLTDTRQTGLPEELVMQRRMLEARALAGVKQYDSALDLIADDGNEEAELLRADIAWQGGNWALAAARSEILLGDKWEAGAPLSDADRFHVMRAAVGYAMAGDAMRLAQFRERYAEKMAGTPDANAFVVVTEEIDTGGFAVRELARKLASVDTLEAFMTEFRARTNPAEEPTPAAVAQR
jgi:hypothetical protein